MTATFSVAKVSLKGISGSLSSALEVKRLREGRKNKRFTPIIKWSSLLRLSLQEMSLHDSPQPLRWFCCLLSSFFFFFFLILRTLLKT